MTNPAGATGSTVNARIASASAASAGAVVFRSGAAGRASTPRPCAPTPPIPCCRSTSATCSRPRATEAKVAWQIAVARDPAFADAWYNLAVAAEDDKQTDLAIALCRMKTQQEWAQTG